MSKSKKYQHVSKCCKNNNMYWTIKQGKVVFNFLMGISIGIFLCVGEGGENHFMTKVWISVYMNNNPNVHGWHNCKGGELKLRRGSWPTLYSGTRHWLWFQRDFLLKYFGADTRLSCFTLFSHVLPNSYYQDQSKCFYTIWIPFHFCRKFLKICISITRSCYIQNG